MTALSTARMAALQRAVRDLGRALPADTRGRAGGGALDAHLLPHRAGRPCPAPASWCYRGELRQLLRRWRPLVVYTAAEIWLAWLMLSKAEERLSSSLTGLLHRRGAPVRAC